MQDPNTADNNLTNPRTGSSAQPGQFLLSIVTYKAVIENLSEILIKTDWRKLKGESKEIATVEFQLRDTILNLERLDADPERYRYEIDLDAILEALNYALEELIWAANLADEAKVDIRSKSSRRIIECRKQLRLAIGLMFVNPG
jgi:hypothetical protein